MKTAKEHQLTIRMSSQERVEIERRATQHNLTLTSFLVRKALDKLETDELSVGYRLEQLEQKTRRLEELAY